MAKSPGELFSDVCFIFRLVDLALAIAGMAIMIDRGTGTCAEHRGDFVLFNLAFSAYFVIMFVIIITMIFDEVAKFWVLAFLIIGFIIEIAAAIVGLINYFNHERGGGICLVLTIFAIVLAVLMLIDAIFTAKKS